MKIPFNRIKNRIKKTKTCWIWIGNNKRGKVQGYGQICIDYKNYGAHRVVYEALVGKIPKGKHLDHLCRNVSCVNPKHLEPVTPKENFLRGEGICAKNARKTQCKRGHSFTGMRDHPRGRACRKCLTLLQKQRRKQQGAF